MSYYERLMVLWIAILGGWEEPAEVSETEMLHGGHSPKKGIYEEPSPIELILSQFLWEALRDWVYPESAEP